MALPLYVLQSAAPCGRMGRGFTSILIVWFVQHLCGESFTRGGGGMCGLLVDGAREQHVCFGGS